MAFWKHNQTSSPQIDAILAKEDLTLNELFDQDCLFQELKSSNKTLIDYITRNDVLVELVRLVTEEPSPDLDEKERYKFANLACEVLTTDIPTINEKLSDKMHLSKLYSFLESDPPLNPLLASFFSRTFSMLICRKHDQHWYSYQYTCLQVLDFLRSHSRSLDLLIKHLGTSAIMELTLKLLTQVEGADLQNTLINLLENECLIDNLMALFEPSVDEDRHYNVSALLCETIFKAKDDVSNTGENGGMRRDMNPILEKIQSGMMVEKLLNNCFGEEVSESSIVSGISVLLALLCPPPSTNINRRGCSDELASGSGDSLQGTNSQMNLLPILSTIMPYLPRLQQLLINPQQRERTLIKMCCARVDPPLGQARLSIVKLVATLISTNTPELNAKLDELNTVQILLDLFFQYTYNNFLHAQVEKCLALALNSSSNDSAQSNPLLPNIFVKCRILQRILSAWEENETEQAKGNRRRGYMGHLINIANNIEKHVQDEYLGRFIQESVDSETLESWKQFVSETLNPINDIHSRCLGGQHPALISDDEELNMKGTFDMQEPLLKLHPTDDSDFNPGSDNNLVFRNYDSSYAQQADFATIIANMPNLEEQYKIQEDIFFKQICSLKEFTWETMLDHKPSVGNAPCNSSDEELDDDELVWTTCSTGGPLVDGGNPWGGLDTGPCEPTEPSEGWANFDSNFSQGFPSDPVQYTGPHPLPSSQKRTLSREVKSGLLSSLVADDEAEDCDPPREFEFEDSVEPDEETFQPACNAIGPNTGCTGPSKGTAVTIDSAESDKDSSVPSPGVESTQDCKESNTDTSSDSKGSGQQTLVPGGHPPVEVSKELVESGDNNANIAEKEAVNSRLVDKPEAVDSASVTSLVSDEREKKNQVPESSGKAAVEVGDTNNEDKKVEDPI